MNEETLPSCHHVTFHAMVSLQFVLSMMSRCRTTLRFLHPFRWRPSVAPLSEFSALIVLSLSFVKGLPGPDDQ